MHISDNIKSNLCLYTSFRHTATDKSIQCFLLVTCFSPSTCYHTCDLALQTTFTAEWAWQRRFKGQNYMPEDATYLDFCNFTRHFQTSKWQSQINWTTTKQPSCLYHENSKKAETEMRNKNKNKSTHFWIMGLGSWHIS